MGSPVEAILLQGWLPYLLLFAVGCTAGVINVLAGGGSFLTVPLLIFLGLPASTANGTNRVAVVLQSLGAVWGFQRHGVVQWAVVRTVAIPTVLGSIAGAWIAILIPDAAFKKIFAGLMVGITIFTIWNPRGHVSKEAVTVHGRPWLWLVFFLVGGYGGFVQAGVGFFLLAATSIAGMDLVKGNAAKVLLVLLFTTVSMIIFAWEGKVHWPMGLTLAAGTVLGGLVGVRMAVLKGHAWLRHVVLVAVIVFAVLLWFGP